MSLYIHLLVGNQIQLIRSLSLHWSVGCIECIEEETFFQKNFGLTMDDIFSEYDYKRSGDQREPGWWMQQLIKLGAGTQIEGISSTYVVWDGKHKFIYFKGDNHVI
jgi:hypothetical protein